jgi:hypothetical protein
MYVCTYEVEGKIQYGVKIQNGLADLENKHDNDIIRVWETIIQNVQI